MDSLNEELTAMTGLLDLIKQEQTQLVDANIEGLQSFTQEKAKAIAKICQLASNRHAFLAAAGLPGIDASMPIWLDSTANSTLRKTWVQLLSVAETAKELNRLNGVLINKFMTRNQDALHILQGNTKGNNFYGRNGQTTTAQPTRRLIIG